MEKFMKDIEKINLLYSEYLMEANKKIDIIKDNIESLNKKIKDYIFIFSKLSFNNVNVEFTLNETIKFTLFFKNGRFIEINIPLENEDFSNYVLISIYQNEKFLSSNIYNLENIDSIKF